MGPVCGQILIPEGGHRRHRHTGPVTNRERDRKHGGPRTDSEGQEAWGGVPGLTLGISLRTFFFFTGWG